MSVVKVEHAETYESGGRPKLNGLLDPRMGTVDRNQKCLTCQENMNDCPGHFGHIELERPVMAIGFLPRIKKVLECVCHSCSRIKCDYSTPKFAKTQSISDPKARLRAVWDVCKGKMICEGSPAEQEGKDFANSQDSSIKHGCGSRQPTVKREGLRFVAVYKATGDDEDGSAMAEPTKQVLNNSKIYSILKRISAEDCKRLGLDPEFARPDWFVHHHLARFYISEQLFIFLCLFYI